MKAIARFFSYVLHPVFVPTAGMLIIFYSGISVFAAAQQYQFTMLTLIVLSTVLLPVSMLPALIYLRHIQGFTLDERRERLIPLFFTTICYYVGYILIKRLTDGANMFSLFLLASTVVVFVLLAISLFWKVSMHTAGAGGILALIAILSILYNVDLTLLTALAILCAGIIFSARLALDTHSLSQLSVGFLVGFGVVFVLMSYFLR